MQSTGKTTSIRLIFPGFCAPCCEHSHIKLMIRVRFSRMHPWCLNLGWNHHLRNCMISEIWRWVSTDLRFWDSKASLNNLVRSSYLNLKNSVFLMRFLFTHWSLVDFWGLFWRMLGKKSGSNWKKKGSKDPGCKDGTWYQILGPWRRQRSIKLSCNTFFNKQSVRRSASSLGLSINGSVRFQSTRHQILQQKESFLQTYVVFEFC